MKTSVFNLSVTGGSELRTFGGDHHKWRRSRGKTLTRLGGEKMERTGRSGRVGREEKGKRGVEKPGASLRTFPSFHIFLIFLFNLSLASDLVF
jgi:hypothetical protein